MGFRYYLSNACKQASTINPGIIKNLYVIESY